MSFFFFALDNQLTGHGSLFSFQPMTFKILPYFLISPLVTRYSMGGSVRPVLPQIRPSKERLASRYSGPCIICWRIKIISNRFRANWSIFASCQTTNLWPAFCYYFYYYYYYLFLRREGKRKPSFPWRKYKDIGRVISRYQTTWLALSTRFLTNGRHFYQSYENGER